MMIEILISSSVLIAAVSLLSHLLRERISPHLKYGMWGLVVLRLAGPFIYPIQGLFAEWKSRFSVMNAAEAVHRQVIEGTVLEPLVDNVASGRTYQFEAGELAASPAASAIQKAAGIDWQLWIMAIWILGSLALCGYMVWVNLRFERELCRGRKPYRGKLPAFVTRRVYVVEGLFSPCYVGFGRGEAIYLPAVIAKDEVKVRHALAHEMGHVMHVDRMWGVVRCGLLCLYWTNPFVWLAAILSRRDCELSCDETAVKLLGESERYAYGKTLVDMIAARGQDQTLFSVATTMSAGKSTVRERVKILVKHPKTTGMMCILMAAAVTGLAACTFSGGTGQSAGDAGVVGAEPGQVGSEASDAEMPVGPDTKDAEMSIGPDADGQALTETKEPLGIGDGDALVLLNEARYGNYYELTLQRRDAVTGTALPVDVSLRPKAGGRGIQVAAYTDEAGTVPADGLDMGFGYSEVEGAEHAFKVSFWNVQGAPFYRIELTEGEKLVAYQYRTKDESPVEVSQLYGPVLGQQDTRANIQRIQVFSNAVWILMSGENAEEAQRFYNQNFIGLRLEGETEGQALHLPAAGSQDGRAINLLYQFEPGTFPGNVIKEVVTGKDTAGGWIVTELYAYRLGETVRAFAEAYLSGDTDTVRRYSSLPEADMEALVRKAPGEGVQISYSWDEDDPEDRAYASCRFMAEGETDSYTYLTMNVERIDGTWIVTSAGFEK